LIQPPDDLTHFALCGTSSPCHKAIIIALKPNMLRDLVISPNILPLAALTSHGVSPPHMAAIALCDPPKPGGIRDPRLPYQKLNRAPHSRLLPAPPSFLHFAAARWISENPPLPTSEHTLLHISTLSLIDAQISPQNLPQSTTALRMLDTPNAGFLLISGRRKPAHRSILMSVIGTHARTPVCADA